MFIVLVSKLSSIFLRREKKTILLNIRISRKNLKQVNKPSQLPPTQHIVSHKRTTVHVCNRYIYSWWKTNLHTITQTCTYPNARKICLMHIWSHQQRSPLDAQHILMEWGRGQGAGGTSRNRFLSCMYCQRYCTERFHKARFRWSFVKDRIDESALNL